MVALFDSGSDKDQCLVDKPTPPDSMAWQSQPRLKAMYKYVLYMYNVYPYLCSHLASSSWSTLRIYPTYLSHSISISIYSVCVVFHAAWERSSCIRSGLTSSSSALRHARARSPLKGWSEALVANGLCFKLFSTKTSDVRPFGSFWWFQKFQKASSHITLVKTSATEWWSPMAHGFGAWKPGWGEGLLQWSLV